jgi:CBS domain-containing protein
MLTTANIMQVNPRTVSPETPIKEARYLMETEGTLQLPVIGQNKLAGIVTDRDLCVAVHAPALNEKPVAEFMTADPITVAPDTPIYRAAQILSTYKFGALPVVEGEKLVGLITASQLLAFFASKMEDPNSQIEAIKMGE